VVKDAQGEVVELKCVYDPATASGEAPDGRRVPGTLHWVSAQHAVAAEVRLYDRLFNRPDPMAGDEEGSDFRAHLNPNALEALDSCRVEPGLRDAAPGSVFQFLRLGYFCADPSTRPERPVFNRAVTLRDTWAKIESRG
jgi:glutaminyl-tRNA synthetase